MKIDRIRVANLGIIYDLDLDIGQDAGRLVFLNGSNGRGKTTFLDALKWCFYDEEPRPSKFLSSLALDELEPGQSAVASVIVDMQLDSAGTLAQVQRELTFEKTPAGTARRVGQSRLTVKTRNSSAGSFTDVASQPEIWLQTFFPKRLINFFLFNGELMAKFFDLKVKDNVEDAVREIAGVDRFEAISAAMLDLEAKLNRKIAKLTGKRAEQLNFELETSRDLAKSIWVELQDSKTKLREMKERKEELDSLISSHQGVEVAALRLAEVDMALASMSQKKLQAEQEFQSENLLHGTLGFLSPAFPAVYEQVALAKKEDRLPPPFDPARVRLLLDNQECICGTHLEPDDERTRALQSLIEKHQVASEVGHILDMTLKQIELLENEMRQGWKTISAKNDLVRKYQEDILKLESEKAELFELIKGSNVDEVRAAASERGVLDHQIEGLIGQAARLENQGEVVSHKMAQLEREMRLVAEGNSEAESLSRQARLAGEIAVAAQQIHAVAIRQVRERLERTFSEKFAVVKKGTFITQISDDFVVKILNQRGQETELSEGEKMMQAYVFSIALREVVNLGFPLVVDTPFGRLDAGNRAEFALMLSKFLSEEVANGNRQAIFMMHDLEYTPYTRKYFHALAPIERYLGADPKNGNLRSFLGDGIDPDWTRHEAWKDWADGKIQ